MRLRFDEEDGRLQLPGGLALTDAYPALGYTLMAVLVAFAASSPVPRGPTIVKLLALSAVTLGGCWIMARARPAVRFSVRQWMLVLAMGGGHDIIGNVVLALHRPTYEDVLMEIDHHLVGGHLSQWVQAYAWPPLVDYLSVCYVSYFVVAFPLMYVLLHRRKYHDIHRYISIMSVGLFSTFVFYVIIPARTPDTLWNTLGAASPIVFDGPVQGVWLTEPIRQFFSTATNNIWDAYPSGHTVIAMLTLFCAWRFDRRTAYWMTPICLSIVASTLMLRYHYLIDVISGAVFAGIVMVGEHLIFQWKQRYLRARSSTTAALPA